MIQRLMCWVFGHRVMYWKPKGPLGTWTGEGEWCKSNFCQRCGKEILR